MRTFPLSSSLPLCNSIVVLDECSPVKGDGLSLSSRLLVDGCEGRGGVGERGLFIGWYHTNQCYRVFSCHSWRQWRVSKWGRGSVGAFVVLINVKGTVGHMHKVNGKNSDWVCKTDQARVNICLAWHEDDERDVQLLKRAFHEYSSDIFHRFYNWRFSLKSIHNNPNIKETSHV